MWDPPLTILTMMCPWWFVPLAASTKSGFPLSVNFKTFLVGHVRFLK